MIRLGDLVGGVLTELAAAQAQAELFGAGMREDFRDHEVLRHLRSPAFRVGRAEAVIPFAVADQPAELRLVDPEMLDDDVLTETATETAAALSREKALRGAFGRYRGHTDDWRSRASREIGKGFASDAPEAPTVDGMSALFGHLARTHYLLGLLRESREVGPEALERILSGGYPDRVEAVARRKMRSKLGGTKEKGHADRPDDAFLFVHVSPKELQGAERVSVLTLEVEEGTLTRATISEPEEEEDEA